MLAGRLGEQRGRPLRQRLAKARARVVPDANVGGVKGDWRGKGEGGMRRKREHDCGAAEG